MSGHIITTAQTVCEDYPEMGLAMRAYCCIILKNDFNLLNQAHCARIAVSCYKQLHEMTPREESKTALEDATEALRLLKCWSGMTQGSKRRVRNGFSGSTRCSKRK